MGISIGHLEKQQNILSNEINHKICHKRRIRNICTTLLFISSFFNFLLGILTVRSNALEYILNERIKMQPGFPLNVLENWSKPNIKIKVNVYLFGVENSKEFLSGIDKKLKLKEIGPIVYDQTIEQTDIVFEENSTLSYTTVRKFEYSESDNQPGIMNQTLVTVNPMMLSLAAKYDNFLMDILFENYDDIFLNRTVYEVLWNSSSLVLDKIKSNPFMNIFLPTDNFGILYNALRPKPERYNVKIGLQNGYKNFWKMNLMNYNTKIGTYEDGEYDECPFSVINASDGTGYPPKLPKDSLHFASSRLPKVFDFRFEKEVDRDYFKAYKFVADNKNFMRVDKSINHCLGQIGDQILPDGVMDGSKLAYDMPLAISNPHFYGFSGDWENYLEGLSPTEQKHSSYVLIEPETGLQLGGSASMQSSVPVPDIKYIKKVKPFSNKIIPLFWIQQAVDDVGLDFPIHVILNIIPVLQLIFAMVFFILSLICILKLIANLRRNRYIDTLSRISERSIYFPQEVIKEMEKNIV